MKRWIFQSLNNLRGLNKLMKAVVKTKTGVGNVEILNMKLREPNAREVRIKVMSAGICGTDIKILHNETWSNPPVVLGHEFSGIVDKVGSDVTDYKPGDRVVSETAQVVCGKCEYCHTGRYLMCPERLSIGYGVDGAFAEYCTVREDILHRVPVNMTLDEAALCEPLAVALHAVFDKIEILPTDKIVVMGPGAVGQLAAQAVKSRGATVILTGTNLDEMRLNIAKEIGIDAVYNIQQCDFNGTIAELTDGKGVDAVFECTGSELAVESAMEILKKTGKMVQVGLTKPSLEINYSLFTGKEISIVGTFGHKWLNWEQAILLISAGKIKVDKLITHHYPLEEWERAFAAMENQEGIKVLIHPNNQED